MGRRAWGLVLLGVLVAYYIYTPLPENVEESWKLILINTSTKTLTHLATFLEFLGLCNCVDLLAFVGRVLEVPPTSDENVTVTDTKFNNIPVRVYVPRRKSDAPRRGVFYIHGGGWSLGSAAFISYDLLSRRTADRLDAVVVSTNYRLAPKYHFPIQFEDVYNALKWFLHKTVLEEYGVDPGRVAVSGDSSGGNLAAAVAQQLLHDREASSEASAGLRAQALLYPALQPLDTDTPSYRDHAHAPVLPRWLALCGWGLYLAGDCAAGARMRAGHLPPDAAPLLPRVNWSSLLPERLLRGRAYRAPAVGSPELATKHPGLLDARAAPLLAADDQLQGLPLTYVVTCQHDVLRDDGLMYVRRLRDAGVRVAHRHVEDGVHGILSFPWLRIYDRLLDEYLGWLGDHL